MQGPDGRLDMDVSVRGQIDGKDYLAVIECKHFNVKSSGRVGRAYIDALDSKRFDLGAQVAIICSDSGFTRGALSKAKRKGIGLISILRKDDDAVKIIIEQEIYLRTIRFKDLQFSYGYDKISGGSQLSMKHNELRYKGLSLDAWLAHRATLVARMNPDVTEQLRATFQFVKPIHFDFQEKGIILKSAAVVFSYETEWRVQTIQLDASMGLYDYVRGKMRLAPTKNQYILKHVAWEEAAPTKPPKSPSSSGIGTQQNPLLPGEIDLVIVWFENLPPGHEGALDSKLLLQIESVVNQEDLDLDQMIIHRSNDTK
ncbi:MAG: restriction endonuclease [Candidatus Heimdallarchaeota archaeon]|nr:restriction endonuclease [Candidatus Heimdallarchaeota archaeon]